MSAKRSATRLHPVATQVAPSSTTEYRTNDGWQSFLAGNRFNPKFSRRDWSAVCLVYPLLILVYAVVLTGTLNGRTVMTASDGDIAYYWLWARSYLGECLRRGIIPHWNPFVMSGTPFLASNQSAVFYPPNWLFATVSAEHWLNVLIVAHWWGALAAMHLLARRLGFSSSAAVVGALVFGFSGFAVLHWWQGHLPFMMEMPYTPLVGVAWVDYVRRQEQSWHSATRFVLLASGGLAMQFFAGHPQIVYFTLVVFGWFGAAFTIHLLSRRALRRAIVHTMLLCVAIGFASVLVAVQALPTVLHARETVRAGVASLEYYTAQSMPLGNLLTLCAPWVWGGRRFGLSYVGYDSYWEVSGFLGTTALMLALMMLTLPRRLSRFQWSCFILVVLSLLLALGRFSGFYEVLMRTVPGLGLFRNPGRFLYVTTFALALLGGEGLDRLIELARVRQAEFFTIIRRTAIAIACGVALVFIVFGDGIRNPIFLRTLVGRLGPQAVANMPRSELVQIFSAFRENLIAAGVMAGLALTVISRLAWLKYEKLTRRLLCGFLLFELIQFARPYAESFAPENLRWPARLVSIVQNAGSLYRVASARAPSDLNQGLSEKIRHVWGYEPTVSVRYAMTMSVAQGRPPGFPEAWMQTYHISPLMNTLGARFLITAPGSPAPSHGWTTVFSGAAWELHENPNALPRAFCAANALTTSTTEIWNALSSPDFAPNQTVYLEVPAEAALDVSQTTGTVGQIELLADQPELFKAKVQMYRDGWFVLMDQYADGWHAKVDGAQARIYRANAVGRALPLREGEHVVEMHYETPGWGLGLLLSTIAWLVYATAAFLAWVSRKRQAAKQPVSPAKS